MVLLMNPAKLNSRIIIQQKTSQTDGEGIAKVVWDDFITIWAGKKPLNGREFFAAGAENAENVVRYEVRYRTDIRTDMRIIDQGRVLDITSVQEDPYENRTRTHLMAKEGPLNA